MVAEVEPALGGLQVGAVGWRKRFRERKVRTASVVGLYHTGLRAHLEVRRSSGVPGHESGSFATASSPLVKLTPQAAGRE